MTLLHFINKALSIWDVLQQRAKEDWRRKSYLMATLKVQDSYFTRNAISQKIRGIICVFVLSCTPPKKEPYKKINDDWFVPPFGHLKSLVSRMRNGAQLLSHLRICKTNSAVTLWHSKILQGNINSQCTTRCQESGMSLPYFTSASMKALSIGTRHLEKRKEH